MRSHQACILKEKYGDIYNDLKIMDVGDVI